MPAPTIRKIKHVFPGAQPLGALVAKVSGILWNKGFHRANTMVATSLCCDELTRPLESAFGYQHYGDHFSMGGLAGFPFGGRTAFGAMAAHIPDKGHCLVVYGPHVGVDLNGTVGTVERRGCDDPGACCGSATAASKVVLHEHCNPQEAPSVPEDRTRDMLDIQQGYVVDMLTPYADRLAKADDLQVTLSYALQEAQREMVESIVFEGASRVPDGYIAILGGIHINTPAELEDYYWPQHLDLYNNKGEKQDEFTEQLFAHNL
eukprot:Nitzschia sp. Nitz4//scaffold127_size64804//54925//55860//NITZ4_006187-RA/size64804-augustus-gene-0.55-mRNA-1//1//CDS//3329534783//8745//frame0